MLKLKDYGLSLALFLLNIFKVFNEKAIVKQYNHKF